MIRFLLGIPARLKLWALAFGAGVLAVLGIYAKGRADAAHKRDVKDLKQELEAHDRITEADTGRNLSDDERSAELREFARKYGKRK